MSTRRGVLLGAALAVLLTACTTDWGSGGASGGSQSATGRRTAVEAAPTAGAAPGAAGPRPTRPAHVVIAVFENEGVDALARAPFLRQLAAQGAAFTDAHGITHPSQPNYLALFSGSTQGLLSDACPQSFRGDNLAAQLLAAGLSFTGYSEGLPGTGDPTCSAGRYARKHNPWADFPALPGSVNQPLSAVPADPAQLPTVAVVVPDLCHDMHDCSVETGDAWARQHLGPYAAWAATHDSLLVLTFDEDEGTRANHIPTFVVGTGVRVGTSDQRVDHYSLLRTVEDLYGLPPLGAAASATPLAGIGG